MEIIKTDCLVIGTGLSGCATALEVAKAGHDVLLLTKTERPESTSSYYAQGGIIYTSKIDSPDKLKRDIIDAGDDLCNEKAVDTLIEWGPRLVKELLIDEVKVKFDISDDGSYDLTEEGGHSTPRILHVSDHTGKSIEKNFLNHLDRHKNIKILTGMTALDLLTVSHHSKNPLDIYEDHACFGAYVFDQKKNKVMAVISKELVLATGGLGQIYLHTTNPEISRGDGYTMASRAGANLLNMEYIQFHPTTLFSKSNERFLISESLRGEGGKLLNKYKKEFMQDYHEKGSLAPRDIVSRGIHEEMLKNSSDHVWLDISFKDKKWIMNRFPHIYASCLRSGVDITESPIPVVPSAHYACGGVVVDEFGRTSIKNLRATGEVSCTGVHGANRLASTSLLEDVVWGVRTGRDIGESLKKNEYYLPEVKEWSYENEDVDPALMRQDWLMIKHTMWNYVGLVRTEKRLQRAKKILTELMQEIESFYAKSTVSDALIGLRNGIRTANIVLNMASKNRYSRGTHFIKD